MPLPDRLALINRRATNPVLRTVAGRLPPLALVVHRGRTSGRPYRTPVLAFPDGRGFAIALTYGPDRDWVKNVRAAGGCALLRGGRQIPLRFPEIVGEGEGLPLLPGPLRPVVRRLGVTTFLRLRPGDETTTDRARGRPDAADGDPSGGREPTPAPTTADPVREGGSSMAPTIVRVANLVLAGMLTGNEFGSRATVHPALRDLPPTAHVQAEQAVTRRYGWIMPAFMSSTIASFVPVLALDRDRRAAPFRFTLAGMLCYGAMLAITLAGNVPINRRLLALSPETTPREELLALTERWGRLHTARNVLNVTGLTLTALGAVWRPRNRA